MKSLKESLFESTNRGSYTVKPRNKGELKQIIKDKSI